MKSQFALMGWILGSVGLGTGHAQLTLQVTPLHDSYVNSDFLDASYGLEESLFVHAGSNTKRTYLQFDLSAVALESVVSASLVVGYGQASRDGTLVDLHHVLNDTWQETSLTWRSMPGYETPPLDTVTIDLGKTEVAWTVPLSGLVSDSDRRLSLLLRLQDEGGLGDTTTFFSKESTLPLARPPTLFLTLPEPEGMTVMVGVGLVAWALRRRGRRGEPLG